MLAGDRAESVAPMTIELNGEPLELDEPATVAAVVERAGATADRRGRRRRRRRRGRPAQRVGRRPSCSDGQRVEVVGAIQGG